MDESKKMILEKRIEKTMKALEKNKMKSLFTAENRQQALELVKELLQPGQTVACGGSVTLDECGILQLLRSGDYHFLDRSAPGLTPEQSKGMLKQAFLADVYLLSANAITENGELYNVDGRFFNRAAALAFGPDSVTVVAGYNKIVADLPAAVERVKKIAAPANATRLHCKTPCAAVGECMDCHSVSAHLPHLSGKRPAAPSGTVSRRFWWAKSWDIKRSHNQNEEERTKCWTKR